MRLFRSFSRIPGFATPSGTETFSQRNTLIPSSHYRRLTTGHLVSSLGIGTYIGPPDDETDLLVQKAIERCVLSGAVNHIDTAINYRYQKAERSVGRAVQTLVSQGVRREELWIASKVGYIPEDADNGVPGSTVTQRLIEQGKLTPGDIAGNVHCLHPSFLEDQLSRSLTNLQLSTLDLLYLHNPSEGQLPLIGKSRFLDRLSKAFEYCESAIQSGLIRNYGLATWLCFRSPPEETDIHLDLIEIMQIASKIGGNKHGLRFIQLPINLMMPESFVHKWQPNDSGVLDLFLNTAFDCHVNVVSSSPLMQGKLLQLPLPKVPEGVTDAGAQHLQVVRSLPSSALKSTLVGLKSPSHVDAVTSLSHLNPLSSDQFWSLLKPDSSPKAQIAIKLR